MDGLLRTTSLKKVVTFATRPKRPSEVDGVDYHFVSPDEFDSLFQQGEVVEKVRVYNDFHYGSPRLVQETGGPDRLIELDPEGHSKYVSTHAPHITSIFLLPPSLEQLRHRIEARHAESNLGSRLRAAAGQLRRASEYDFIVVNDDLEAACDIARAIVRATQQTLARKKLLALAEELGTQSE